MAPRMLTGMLERIGQRLGLGQMFREIASGSAWLLADRLFRMLLGLAVGILVARHLGPADYGALSYTIAFVVIFGFLGTLGLDAILVRDLARDPDRKGSLLGSALGLRLAGSVLAYAACMGVALAFTTSDERTLQLVAILSTGFVFQSLDVFDQWFQSGARFHLIAIMRSGAFVVSAILRIALVMLDAGAIWFAAVIALEAALVAAALGTSYRVLERGHGRLVFDRGVALQLLRESWPLAVSSLFVILTMQLDKVLIGQMLETAQVGIYSVATQLSSVWYMVPVVIGTAAAPSLARLQREGGEAYATKLQTLYRLLTLASVGIAALLTLAAKPLVSGLFGDEFLGAERVLMVHAWTAVFVFHVSIRTRALVAEGKQAYVTLLAGLTFVASVVLSVILIGRNGAIGAAQASLLAWMACALVFPVFWKPTRGSAAMFIASFWPSGKR